MRVYALCARCIGWMLYLTTLFSFQRGIVAHLAPHLLHKGAPEPHNSFQLCGVLANQKLPTPREVPQATQIGVAILENEGMEAICWRHEREEGQCPHMSNVGEDGQVVVCLSALTIRTKIRS